MASSSGAIPPAPSFADFRFSTIGQEPLLLKRISAQPLDLPSPCPSSPAPGELTYPSAAGSPRPLPRPALPQPSTHLNPSGNDAIESITCTASKSSDAQDTRFAQPHLLPRAQGFAPSQHTSTALSTVPRNVAVPGTATSPGVSSSQKQPSYMSPSPSEVAKTPIIFTAPTTKRKTPLPAARVHQTHSPYAALRALQGRLMTSLTKLHPPDMSNALLRIQMANSHSVNALTTAHRSHILAQQSLATAQEAVTAAQECLSAAELARKHVNDAVITIRQLHSGKVDFDAEVNAEWEWKVNFIQLQDDLRMLGEWLVEKESEDTTSLDGHRENTRDENMVEAVISATRVPGSDSIVKDRSSELPQSAGATQSRSSEASRVTPYSDLRNLNHKESLELEADIATKAWSSEQIPALRSLPPITAQPAPVEGDVAERPPLKDDGAIQESAKFNEPHSFTSHHQGTLAHHAEDEACMQAQARSRKSPEKTSEATPFLKSQREYITSEVSGSTVNGLQPKLSMTQVDVNTDTPQQFKSQSSVVFDDAQRTLQLTRDKEAAFSEGIEYKRESHRGLEELKQRQLDEPEKEGRLTADKEQELIAEQERRRQEIMAQKQRANAETAARIKAERARAERAREREKTMILSLQSPTSSTPQSSLPDCTIDSETLIAKKAATLKLTNKLTSLSVGDRIGSTTNGQPQRTIESDPSTIVPESAALRCPPSKGESSTDTGLELTKAGNVNSNGKPTQNYSMVTFQTPTPSQGINGGEELHAYRHSNDPGNLYLVSRSQVVPACPAAQAVNLRSLKNGNGVRYDTTTLFDRKSEYLDQSFLHQKSPVKEESPVLASLDESQTRSQPELSQSVNSHPSFLPAKSFSTLPSMRKRSISNEDISVDQRGIKGTTEAVPASSATGTSSAVSSLNTLCPLSNVTPPNPHRDDLSSPRNNLKPLLTSKLASEEQNLSSTTAPASLDLTTTDPNFSSDGTHIAPATHANDGWDRPVDEETYSGDFTARELTLPKGPRQSCRTDDQYSPPRAPNSYASRGYAMRSNPTAGRSSLSPAPRSPVLGKRRQREHVREDEHPIRRHWQTDGMRRTRSPFPHHRHSAQGRSVSPDRTTHHAQMQDIERPDMSRTRSPPSREHAWRSPSPYRPALQARIGVSNPVDRSNNGGQRYRPTYSPDNYERNRPWTRDNYPVRQIDQSVPGQRLGNEPELRGSYHSRSRGSSNNRVSPRRGSRGGSRFLNLEQRIASSAKPWTLINRLESPQRD
ncbi:hypothetical protein C0993_001672 [Termitomyces sp. T159_Od127]|nr:hypothetical protein C0993_001672 [Termitomyces sp. T159_Od127]